VNRQQRRAAGWRGRIVEGEPVRRIVDHCRRIGCICVPDVRFAGPIRYGEVSHISVAHDDGCPLADCGTSVQIIDPPEELAS
jgi:hypothetical protein